jgi:hypothetical protein
MVEKERLNAYDEGVHLAVEIRQWKARCFVLQAQWKITLLMKTIDLEGARLMIRLHQYAFE